MDLMKKLSKYIETGVETSKIELKRELDITTRPNKAEFVKDVLAIANTKGWNGYIIIGVLDEKDRFSDNPSDCVVGYSTNPDEFKRQMIATLTNYSDPVPQIDYQELQHHPSEKKIGVVIIPHSPTRPHLVARDGEGIRDGDIFVRRGAATFKANRREIDEMNGYINSAMLINFSHPITDTQREQIQQLTGMPVEEIIDVETKLDLKKPLAPQIDALIERVNLTSEEWDSTSPIINVPGFASAVAVLLAKVHGLTGHFPTILSVRRVEGSTPPSYEVVEVLNLSEIRDESRNKR